MNDQRESGQERDVSASSDRNEAGRRRSADEGVGPVAPQAKDAAGTEYSPGADRAAGSHPPIGDLLEPPNNEQPPVAWRELIGVLCLIVVSDLAIYRGEGFAGYALLFFVAPFLLWLGSPRQRQDRGYGLSGPCWSCCRARWCGVGRQGWWPSVSR